MTHKEYIRGEIAAWKKEGVISDDLAEKLSARYAEEEKRLSWGAVLAGAVGALLIGLGIIALFAANWDSFGRGARAAISISPVLVCGVIALVAAKKDVETMALWEPLGILWTVATGAAACLIAQTYQVGGSVPGLILFVALLTLPISWVTRSVTVTSLWAVFAIAWTISYESLNGESWSLVFKGLGLMALSIPGYVAFLRRKPVRAALVTGQLLSGLVYSLGAGILICSAMPQVWSFRVDACVGVFWACSALVAGIGFFGKLPCWPVIGTLVAAGAAVPTPFEDDSGRFVLALVLAIAIATVGIRRIRLTYTNIGAALFLWLVLVKFFMSDTDFTVKGIVLIIAGVALTVLNVVMIKAKKRRAA